MKIEVRKSIKKKLNKLSVLHKIEVQKVEMTGAELRALYTERGLKLPLELQDDSCMKKVYDYPLYEDLIQIKKGIIFKEMKAAYKSADNHRSGMNLVKLYIQEHEKKVERQRINYKHEYHYKAWSRYEAEESVDNLLTAMTETLKYEISRTNIDNKIRWNVKHD